MIKVTLIGTGGMLPLPDRFLSSCLLEFNGKSILIDCGEGTQVSLSKGKVSISKIEIILITHCHADHITGLPGLLLTLGNCNRTEPVYIIGPKGILEVVKGLMVICKFLPYELKIIELPIQEPDSFEGIGLNITSIPLMHPVDCLGYSFELKLKPHFNPEKAKKLNIPISMWRILHKGEDVEFDGKIITHDMVLEKQRKSLKISYCTDTRPTEYMQKLIKNSDLFICEGMYGEDSQYENAVRKRHMLFSEAAKMAKEAEVGELWLTHYSPSLLRPKDFIENIKPIFENTIAGYDLMSKEIKPDE